VNLLKVLAAKVQRIQKVPRMDDEMCRDEAQNDSKQHLKTGAYNYYSVS